MVQSTTTTHLESLIRSAFDEGRCGDYYLVDLEVSPSHRIAVYMDGDEGVSLDVCTRVSRILEAFLDEEPTLGGVYTLEVSSPGVNRPLRFARQYAKHAGRTLQVSFDTGETIEGVLHLVTPEMITLEIKPKSKKNPSILREIPFGDIKEAYVIITFGEKK